jgi:hypothetical protein
MTTENSNNGAAQTANDDAKRAANANANTEKQNAQKNASKGKSTGKKSTGKGTAQKKVDKPAKGRAESNEEIGMRLLKEHASEQRILDTFTKVYKEKKGITDKKFVQARAHIYMKIAEKRAEAAKAKNAKVKKAS